ncbi:unnamed protein product [Parnassius apollo]|uniref:(apollo) hypothetical protein n=1 Tax=Parnassius apollo TaxID=110799 RepID=A0A8S3XPP7_PARAO|nr:unnamed protein product [Parnassius apollo]
MSLEDLIKLDKVSLKKLTDGEGPCDECICHILTTPRDKCMTAMMKRCVACILCRRRKKDKKSKGGKKAAGMSSKAGVGSKKSLKGVIESLATLKVSDVTSMIKSIRLPQRKCGHI